MNQFPNHFSLYQDINSQTDATNVLNNNQFFNEPTKEFLNSLNEILTKQNQNFLGSMQTTLTNVIHNENKNFLESIRIILTNVIRNENQNFLGAISTTLTNVIRNENKINNIKIKTIIESSIREQLKNSHSFSEDSERSCFTFTFGTKRKEPVDSKKKKKKKKNTNPKIDFFSARDADEAPLDNKKSSKTTDD